MDTMGYHDPKIFEVLQVPTLTNQPGYFVTRKWWVFPLRNTTSLEENSPAGSSHSSHSEREDVNHRHQSNNWKPMVNIGCYGLTNQTTYENLLSFFTKLATLSGQRTLSWLGQWRQSSHAPNSIGSKKMIRPNKFLDTPTSSRSATSRMCRNPFIFCSPTVAALPKFYGCLGFAAHALGTK